MTAPAFRTAPVYRTAVVFDMRRPDFGTPTAEMYDVAFEMIEFADKHGVGNVSFPEHHCSDDGYVPTPMLMATAAAARTTRIGVMAGALVLPLHDPVDVAEQITVLDHLSQGRSHVVLAAGYAEQEFKLFGKSLRDRAALMDHHLDVITRALTGERFIDGEREIYVRPLPRSARPSILVGGGVPAGAVRAARFGLGLWTLDDAIIPLYEEECRKRGHAPGDVIPPSIMVHVTEHPDEAWEAIAPHVAYAAGAYAALSSDPSESSSPWHGLSSMEAVKASGIIQVVTPDECVALAQSGRPLKVHPLIGGMPTEIGWKNLELFATRVVPALAA